MAAARAWRHLGHCRVPGQPIDDHDPRRGLCRRARLADEALVLDKEIGNKRGIAIGLKDLARWARYQGQRRRSRELLDESLPLRQPLGDKPGIASCLLGFVAAMIEQERFDRGALMLGAIDRLVETIGGDMDLINRGEYNRERAPLHQALGDAAFTAAREQGRALDVEQLSSCWTITWRMVSKRDDSGSRSSAGTKGPSSRSTWSPTTLAISARSDPAGAPGRTRQSTSHWACAGITFPLILDLENVRNSLGALFDVAAHRLLGLLAVVGFQRRDERLLLLLVRRAALGNRFRGRLGEIAEHHRGEGGPHLIQRADQVSVPAGGVDRLMELAIEPPIVRPVFLCPVAFHCVHQAFEFLQLLGCNIPRGVTCRSTFQKGAAGIEIQQIVQLKLEDADAAVGDMFGEAFADEVLQRFADGGLAHAEFSREGFLAEPFAGLEFIRADRGAQSLRDQATQLGGSEGIGRSKHDWLCTLYIIYYIQIIPRTSDSVKGAFLRRQRTLIHRSTPRFSLMKQVGQAADQSSWRPRDM